MSETLNAALACAAIGFHVFPAPPGQRKSFKSAAFSQGRRWGATDSPMEIAQDWKQWPNANLGIACGPDSKLLVIDIDGLSHGVDGFASWDLIIQEHGDIPETPEVDTPSGGRHLYFRWTPECDGIVNSASMIGPGIDVRAEGGMVIAPPSIKPNGGMYMWRSSLDVGLADPPAWLIERCKRKEKVPSTFQPLPSLSGGEAWARRALDAEATAVLTAGQGKRNETLNTSAFNLGQIIGGGGLDRGAVEATLERAAVGAGLPIKEVKATIASGLAAGERQPRKPQLRSEAPVVDITELIAKGAQQTSAPTVEDYDNPTLDMLIGAPPGDMPDVYHFADGVLAEAFEYMKGAMRREWPEAAFLTALQVVGIAIGRNFATWTNLRSNLYTVILAGSGWGKSSIYGPAVDLMVQAGLKDMIGAERIMSDSGLIQEIQSHPEHKKIYFLDEFGHMLQQCTARGAGGHVRKIVTEFTNLYTKAYGIFSGSAYADGRNSASMDCPHINIFGMATPGQFWEAFGSGALEDGTLPRFSILKAAKRPPRKSLALSHQDDTDAARSRLAPSLSRLATMRKNKTGNLGYAPGVAPEVIKVMPAKEAGAVWKQIGDAAEDMSIEAEEKRPDKDLGGILARVAETASKIALIFAVSRNPDHPVISEADMIASRRLAWWFAHVAIEGAMIHISDSVHASMKQKALNFIKGGPGGQRSHRDVARKLNVPSSELGEIMKSLIEAELVARGEVKHPGGARPVVTYLALRD